MSYVAIAFIVVGGVTALLTSLLILVKAFRESPLWGLGSLLVPIVGLVFVVKHWRQTGGLFLCNLAASALIGVGALIAPMGAQNLPGN